MTALIALLVAAVATVLAVVVIRLDADRRDGQIDAELLQQVDELARQVDFVDGQLQPEAPQGLLGPNVAMVVVPEVDILELNESDELAEIEEPSDEEISFWVEDLLGDLDDEPRGELIGQYRDDDEDDDDVIERLIADPPPELWDEGYRRYLYVQADALDIDLTFAAQQTYFTGDVVDGGLVGEAYDIVVFDDEDGRFELEGSNGDLYVRGTPLLDGLEARGAIVAFVESETFDAAHRSLRTRVITSAVLVTLASIAAAWFVAGRTIRPVALALGQQERFLADAAHELRTPITAMRTSAEAALGPNVPDQDRQAALERVAAVARDASTLTDDLMTLARMDADGMPLERESVRLDLLVEALIDDRPEFRLQASEVVVDADARLLARALDNLLRNAVAHGQAEAAAPATVTVDAGGVSVRDHGPGIKPSELDAIFERFRTSSTSRGHGLGLPLARWIARAHGGDLIARNVDAGAEFRLTLP